MATRRTRRSSFSAAEVGNKEFDDKELEAIGDVGDAESGKDGELIEDPSELGEDADDVAAVIDNVDGKEDA